MCAYLSVVVQLFRRLKVSIWRDFLLKDEPVSARWQKRSPGLDPPMAGDCGGSSSQLDTAATTSVTPLALPVFLEELQAKNCTSDSEQDPGIQSTAQQGTSLQDSSYKELLCDRHSCGFRLRACK